MNGNEARQGRLALAQIESDLLKAEEAFADAENRIKQAERDRLVALETINRHQIAFDDAIAQFRQRSIPGSRWHRETGDSEESLILHGDAQTAPTENTRDSTQSDISSVALEFKRLKNFAQSKDNDPVLTVAVVPRPQDYKR